MVRNRIGKISFDKVYIGGQNVTLHDRVSFFENPLIFGNVVIGRCTSISGPSTRICSNINEVKIGNFCSIASNVIIQEFYHNVNLTTTYNILSNLIKDKDSKLQVVSKGNIIIEDDVWIGSNVSILSGVKIGRGAVIGAGSVVTKDIPSYSIAAGNPCKVIKPRFDKETIRLLEDSKWWEWDDEKIKNNAEFFKINRNSNDK
ncbi:CatB-related O-acetyltransferase [Elizabethkingia sp. YR214]|uniref:CatB-related O-acetyltransferase n=1 Tax=Elizabethkingia sp. YR214 TaxID=2135667 RepID=UPI000D30A91B|nr:CatB-related O-acetyltransferase [Elizabethkingia sp. YR214]